jgi:hypothetical protein
MAEAAGNEAEDEDEDAELGGRGICVSALDLRELISISVN